jgi:hypothetical protein
MHGKIDFLVEEHPMKLTHCSASLLLLLASGGLGAQQPADVAQAKPTTAAEAPQRDTSYIDAQGTAHVTRVVPIPESLSPQAQLILGRAEPDQGPPEPLAEPQACRCASSLRKECPRAIATRFC